jgi:hypothetical protein
VGIPVPIGNRHFATVQGVAYKFVKCERCTLEYAYRMVREGEGARTSLLFLDEAGASDGAVRDAQTELQHRLERGVDVVPCPRCGFVSPRMVRKARREYRRWMMYTGVGVLIALAPGFMFGALINMAAGTKGGEPLLPWWAYCTLTGVLATAAAGLAIGRWLVARRHDPNTGDAQALIRRGQELALSPEEFAHIIGIQPNESPATAFTNTPPG